MAEHGKKPRCDHDWRAEHMVYAGRTAGERTVRRWCKTCGVVQHSYTTGRWYPSRIGDYSMWGDYPDDYEAEGETDG